MDLTTIYSNLYVYCWQYRATHWAYGKLFLNGILVALTHLMNVANSCDDIVATVYFSI